jgi:uncharacterized protein (TIGR00251 family)
MAKKSKLTKRAVEAQEPTEAKSDSKKMESFFYWDGDVLVLNVLGKPSSREDAIGKPKGNQLKISVTAEPKLGKATDHMVKFLAKVFEVSVKDIEVVFGRMNVNKQLRIKAPKKLPPVFS